MKGIIKKIESETVSFKCLRGERVKMLLYAYKGFEKPNFL